MCVCFILGIILLFTCEALFSSLIYASSGPFYARHPVNVDLLYNTVAESSFLIQRNDEQPQAEPEE